jgi:hypothetical protein
MKIRAVGVSRRFGTSAKTNNYYDMAELNVLTELRPNVSAANTFQAAGYRVVPYNLEPTVIQDFINLPYPCDIEIVTEARPAPSGVDTFVVGISQK